MMKKILTVIFTLLLISGILYITNHNKFTSLNKNPKYIAKHYKNEEKAPEVAPFNTGLVEKDRQMYEMDLKINDEVGLSSRSGGFYWVSTRKNLNAIFTFNNHTLARRDIIILCLTDYQQVPCTSSSKVLSDSIISGDLRELSIIFPKVTIGMHKLSVVVLSYTPITEDFANNSEKLSEAIIRSESFIWSDSVTIYADDYTNIHPEITKLSYIDKIENFQGGLSFGVVRANEIRRDEFPHPNFKLDSNFEAETIKVKPDQDLSFLFVGGFSESAPYFETAEHQGLDKTQLPFVIVGFINTEQISLDVNRPNTPIFSTIPKEKSVEIPISFKAPIKPGIYTFYALYKELPFMDMTNPRNSDDGGIIFDAFPDLTQIRITDKIVFEVVPQ